MKLAVIPLILLLSISASAKPISFEASVQEGHSFSKELPGELTFFLEGKGPWTLALKHKKFPSEDLIFPVNPPYRFSNHLNFGEGYNDSARDSVKNKTRTFAFLYRWADAEKVGSLIDSILWPKSDQQVEVATAALSKLPQGQGKLEILESHFGDSTDKSGKHESLKSLRLKVVLDWPQ